MAEPEKPKEPDYKKYESITSILGKDAQEHLLGLEDAVTRAWVDHTKGTPTDKNQGEGLADKIYNAADDYIRKQFYGDTKPQNERAARLLNENIQELIGYTADGLSKMFDDKKVVHIAEMSQLVKLTQEKLQEELKKDYGRALNQLKEADFEPFRDYVLKLASEVGLSSVTKDSMARLSEVIKVYDEEVRPEYQEYLARMERRKAKEKAKEKKKSP
jgi:hypothetical protein